MKFEAKPWQKTLYIRTGPHHMFVETPWTLQGCPFLFEHWRSTSSKLWSPWHPMVSNGPMVQWMDNNQITSHIQWRKGSHGISVGFSVKWINNYTELAKILAIEFGEEVTQISTNISKIPYTKKDTKWRVMHFRWLSSIIEYKYLYIYSMYNIYVHSLQKATHPQQTEWDIAQPTDLKRMSILGMRSSLQRGFHHCKTQVFSLGIRGTQPADSFQNVQLGIGPNLT